MHFHACVTSARYIDIIVCLSLLNVENIYFITESTQLSKEKKNTVI